ncbi:MAG: tRNA (N(6)-L-threonylcarbamoyladenosine(37)-C(2))-methylthiotransferase MtaB [bacterium]
MTADPHTERNTAPIVINQGCRLNGYESEKMVEMAKAAAVKDTVIINSCAVTNEAVRQTRQNIRKAARNYPDHKIIVTGCAAQIDPKSFAAMPEVTAILGNQEKMQAASWQGLKEGNIPALSDIMQARFASTGPIAGEAVRARAYVEIQNGCDHRCTFCIIPFGRGNSRSVPIDRVVAEIQNLREQQVQEVVLTGVDITSWGSDLPGRPGLGQLVDALLTQIPELPRLRLSSIDGAEIDQHLLELITTQRRIAPYLHLSLQSGNTMILKRMKRRHNRQGAIDFCQQVLQARPDMAFGADIIVGFPTESESMFEDSLSLVDECQLRYLHVFPFSPRQGTPAARMPQLPKSVIKERAARLRAKGDEALAAFLGSFIGTDQQVLTEKSACGTVAKGRLANFAEVEFNSISKQDHLAGQFRTIRIKAENGRQLIGQQIGDRV